MEPDRPNRPARAKRRKIRTDHYGYEKNDAPL